VISARGFGFNDPNASFVCKISPIEAVVLFLHGCLAHAIDEQCNHYISIDLPMYAYLGESTMPSYCLSWQCHN
jgi:hypothetical protein